MTDLTKWPLLLVTGEPVTEVQANEILIRTDDWMLMTNDKSWATTVAEIAGAKLGPHGFGIENDRKFRQGLGVLDLHYLSNSRIASSWIGGPKGWCDWDGTIGTSNYNLGKWPTVEDVEEDWITIAEAFPFLDLSAQLIPDEGEAGYAAVEWRIENGTVESVTPAGFLRRPTDPQLTALFTRHGERGVSPARLRVALQQVKDGRPCESA